MREQLNGIEILQIMGKYIIEKREQQVFQWEALNTKHFKNVREKEDSGTTLS